ncbi:MAG: hypothetical protein MUF33_02040 [Candidatus Nanopelagicales bacterium]|jgi:hypothetical protein|nr:hypothetical protein [Candidatus Nanopelagicales bacterium]
MGEYDRVEWRDSGQYVTRRQHQALVAAEKKIRRRYWGFRFQMPQGSWKPVTSWSGTTHTDAGVCDLWYEGIGFRTRRQKRKYQFVLTVLKNVGRQAAFGRGPWDDMVLHFHVIDLDPEHMDSNAIWQAGQYRVRDNGLNVGVPDKFPWRPDPIRRWRFQTAG